MRSDNIDWGNLVERYIDVSNKRDIDGILKLLHPGAAYFDAYWGETCVGRDLRQYLKDWFATDRFHYARIGEIIESDIGAAFRYSAIDASAKIPDEAMYFGTEILTARDDKIVTISDHYCDPTIEATREIIEVTVARHGQSRYATAGYGVARMTELRRRMTELIETRDLHLDAELTVHELADLVGCTPGQLIALATGEVQADSESEAAKRLAEPATEVISRFTDSLPAGHEPDEPKHSGN